MIQNVPLWDGMILSSQLFFRDSLGFPCYDTCRKTQTANQVDMAAHKPGSNPERVLNKGACSN